MKKIIFFFVVFLGLALGAQAQNSACCKAGAKNGKGCAEMKAAQAQTPIAPEYQTAAAKVASLDVSIEPRTNPITGEVSYVRKQSGEKNGEVTFVALNFDPATSTFVNVGPSQMEAGKDKNTQSCGAHSMTTGGKSCCAMGANSKSCCADKMKSASASSSNSSEAKPVKTGGSN